MRRARTDVGLVSSVLSVVRAWLFLYCRPGLAAAGCVGEYLEHKCWYPKDSELCLARMKSGETLMEVRSDSDVQIDRRSWV